MTLADLEIGKSATVTEVGGEGALRQHFLDMGLIPGVTVTLTKYAPMGDPMELSLHGYQLTLRKADAARLLIEPLAAEIFEGLVHVDTFGCLVIHNSPLFSTLQFSLLIRLITAVSFVILRQEIHLCQGFSRIFLISDQDMVCLRILEHLFEQG